MTAPPPPASSSAGSSSGSAAAEDGWIFGRRYRVEAPIARGGMGEVWTGYDTRLDRRVAIKLMHQSHLAALRPDTAEGRAVAETLALDRERFIREIRTTARLELPGIPAVYDFGVDEPTSRVYLVMQLLYGQTLAELIGSRDYATDPWPIGWAAAVGAQVAATLVDVHRVDVVHRDIKPSNLMVAANGLVKVLDFGVAILHGASALPRLTQVGMTVGSPPYMSREQVLGNPVGPAADVYALGCVLHEMVTGRVPFLETPTRSYQDQHVNRAPEPLRVLRSDVPADLDALVLAMLAKDPANRPDAEAVYDALLPFIGSGASASVRDERDPRRPFLRPLGPASRARRAPRPAASARPPLTIDEALDIREQVGELLGDSLHQRAIDLLDDAVRRSAHSPELDREMKIELASVLYSADEFGRAAELLDEVLPSMGDDAVADLLRYYAGASHAELGHVDEAITYLSAFVERADPGDRLYVDAVYQLGMALAAVGRRPEALSRLRGLRPLLIAEYGPSSVHVTTLDRRITRISQA